MSDPPAETSGKGITALFVRRPVLAFVINALIVVAGLAAFFGVEIRELPDVDRPVITVNADFTGAAGRDRRPRDHRGRSRARWRASPASSRSRRARPIGRSRVTVEFNDGIDLDVAASDVRDAVSRITNQLPDDADAPRIVKADANADAIMRLAVTSDTLSVEDLTILVEDEIVERWPPWRASPTCRSTATARRSSASTSTRSSSPASASPSPTSRNALSTVAFDTPAGSLTATNQNIIVRATADVTTPEAFENLIIGGTHPARRRRHRDARRRSGATSLRSDGKTGIGLGIIRQAQSNTLDISDGMRAAVERSQQTLPEGIAIRVTSDDAIFIDGAIHEVEIALGLSVSIVCRHLPLPARLARDADPGLTMPVALIGTVAAIYLAGFSVNILTLLALVLATGLVVDDAIVVLENIVRRRNEGMGPRAAAVLGTQEVFFAVIATTATLAAVFVPALLPARPDRRPVPRVRLRARHLGAALGRRRAVALPDARLAHAQGRRRRR